jgi:hypothetical protein
MIDRDAEMGRMTRTLWILWGAFLSASVLYGVVGSLITRGRSTGIELPVQPGLFHGILYGVGGLLLVTAFVLKGRLTRRAYREPYAAMIGLQAAMVTGWAVSELVGIIGLVLVVIGGSLTAALPLVLASLIAIALQRPNTAGLRRRLEEVDPTHEPETPVAP